MLHARVYKFQEKRETPIDFKPKALEFVFNKEAFQDGPFKPGLERFGSGSVAVSLDLTDGYLHVPLRPNGRKFLRLAIGEHHFQFVSLCFGLASAPRVLPR